ncbi:MAG: hypothetical protein IKE24_06800 [Clostridia bacterium]|nr:hypothetical protein [Clostridia bacterium]
MKRKLWIVAVAAALLVMLWSGLALADEYAFTTEPAGTLTVATNEFSIGWTTNFTPVKIQVCKKYYYDAIVKTVTSGLNASMATVVSVNDFDDDFSNTTYAIRAFYGSGSEEYAEGDIQFDLTPFQFIREVEVVFSGEERAFRFTWETGFIPTEAEIWCKYGDNHYRTEITGSQVKYIYGFPGTEAQTFTVNYPAYSFVLIDADWLAGHE